ncbi:helicase-related protein [Butyrivibrio fibrisolvens]|uniref:helicase-related protein n=1 Tax=Pseudobutyrivibrio ruminis TaxID=46206 RepID=UPI000429B34E|nr:helicase-related protein [Pseudobutyrivibrio ruminis]MDC7278057.1 helicase-related protein [Butyrivibrio fibrisolvens]
MALYNEQINARSELINQMRMELLGPGSEPMTVDIDRETISTTPEKRYYVGVLYPQGNKFKLQDDDLQGEKDTGKETLFDEGINEDVEKENQLEESKREDKNYVNDMQDDSMDENVNMSTKLLPSSMGLTFIANKKLEKIVVNAQFALYKKSEVDNCCLKIPADVENFSIPSQFLQYFGFDEESRILRLKCNFPAKNIRDIYERDNVDNGSFQFYAYTLLKMLNSGYVREPLSGKVEVDFSNSNYFEPREIIEGKIAKICALRYHLLGDYYSYTIMMINSRHGKARGINTIFQPQLSISSDDNNQLVFCDIDEVNRIRYSDDESKINALLYRNKKNYGTGLGAAVNWNIDNNGIGVLMTDFFPEVSVPQMDYRVDAKYGLEDKVFSMKYLSDLNETEKNEKIFDLQLLCDSYSKWIDEVKNQFSSISNDLLETAQSNINNCIFCMERIQKGINVLKSNPNAWIAFQLANRAMFMQRAHISIQRDFEKKFVDVFPENDEVYDTLQNIDYYNIEDNSFWRPFQLAFLLMSIPSMTDAGKNKERDLVDLIWFPTGGGKTEAYLGLTAFSIFYRRLAYDSEEAGGTTVIMRYTLRLLASQQFTRAATLICACEVIRKDGESRKGKYPKYDLGDEEISIGLWIGGQHTPNKVKGNSNDSTAQFCYNKLSEANAQNLTNYKERYNKFQVLKCPWCGTKLVKEVVNNKTKGEFGYHVPNGKSFYFACPQEGCAFEERLPLQVVDEELYKNPPTLLFATVDKFAMLPWYKETGAFFGVDSEHRTPELIIQDELHLISGPLGSMVGLYESAVDYLCSSKGFRPKIIASTATICRAKEQCSELYNRKVFQFPPQGIDQGDSFFAREAKDSFGRVYIGILPSGKTKAMTESKIIATLLQKEQEYRASDDIKDCYWTVTNYFNSLKELGKCSSIIQNDVRDNIRRLAHRSNYKYGIRNILKPDELTSRVSTTELNRTLDKLEKIRYSSDPDKKTYPSNILLATNMISVGIDVDRLNVMTILGQPKLTSEYIQASSRVGRKYPGVVFVQYDSARSRDRSHYEQFKAYHESFYKYVEPTGLTPFSEPACQRALHAVVLSILRHGFNYEMDEEISTFNPEEMRDILDSISNYIISRIDEINNRREHPSVGDTERITSEINTIYDRLATIVSRSHNNVVYGNIMGEKPADGSRILKPFGKDKDEELTFDTMTSMRNVDQGVNATLLIMEAEDEKKTFD